MKKSVGGWMDLKESQVLKYPIDVRAALKRSGEWQRRYAELYRPQKPQSAVEDK